MIVLDILVRALWLVVKWTMVIIFGGIWLAIKQGFARWDAVLLRRRDEESVVWCLAKEGDSQLRSCRSITSRNTAVAIFGPNSYDDPALKWRVRLLWHPKTRQLKLLGVGRLKVEQWRALRFPGFRWEITLVLRDRHDDALSFSEMVERENDPGWGAVAKLLRAAECFKKWDCHCLVEARLRELEGYAVTGMLNGCLTINIPEDAPAKIKLALARFSEYLIHASVRLGA